MINKKISLFKTTKWVSFETYIMNVEGFSYSDAHQSYNNLINTFEYKSEAFVVVASYENKNYFIESKELYNNVSKYDKIVVTIKCFYDKNDILIHSTIHHCHPYPLSVV